MKTSNSLRNSRNLRKNAVAYNTDNIVMNSMETLKFVQVEDENFSGGWGKRRLFWERRHVMSLSTLNREMKYPLAQVPVLAENDTHTRSSLQCQGHCGPSPPSSSSLKESDEMVPKR